VEVTGRGVVYGYTVSHYTAEPAWRDQIPWTTIVVELDEGPRVVGTARGFSPGQVHLNVPVRVVTEKINDEFSYLWVESAEASS